ncbi:MULTISPECIES: hypothetical protein [unclassified Halobacteriovorax]|uniref:hypothetical protein n=1 Tax=unclassified Halobacteriovorax TaxID=2639665 RepID=UPI00399AB08E
MKNSSIIKNSILIFILSFFVSIAVYSQDGIYYDAYKIEYRGKLKEEIKKRVKDFEAKVKEINRNYVSIVSKCDNLKGKDFRRCVYEQRGLFKKKYGGNPIELERKLRFKEQFISVASIYSDSIKKIKVAGIGVLLRINSRSIPGEIVKMLAIESTTSKVITEVPFKYSPFAKDFRNNRIKFFHKDDLWLDVDEAKDLIVFDKNIFKMTKGELNKKFSLVGRFVDCSNGVGCDDYCKIDKIEDGFVTYTGEFHGERYSYEVKTVKIKIEDILTEDGTVSCSVREKSE